MVYRGRFAKRWPKLADGAHGPVLQIYKKQNRWNAICKRASAQTGEKAGNQSPGRT